MTTYRLEGEVGVAAASKLMLNRGLPKRSTLFNNEKESSPDEEWSQSINLKGNCNEANDE